MCQPKQSLTLLKENLTEAAFLVAREGTTKEAHSKILECLVVLSELEKDYVAIGMLSTDRYVANLENISSKKINIEDIELAEVGKVTARLERWAIHTSQNNSMILTAFLKLQQSSSEPITVEQLREAFFKEAEEQKKIMPSGRSKENIFLTNFTQMKNIAERNHGKVFDQVGFEISIWPRVADAVSEYGKKVLK